MRYGSLFSGIEAASLAFEPLGWNPRWFAEIDPFCRKVLERGWPSVPNLGDVLAADFVERAEKVDLIIGGSPCPSFSQAGKRKGLEDPRGTLSLRYCEIIDKARPEWLIWENVPGVISSNEGKDFEVIINAIVKSGYGVCWRILDARCFGLPQSRKRLYVVGRLGGECPVGVLDGREDSDDGAEEHESGEKKYSLSGRGMDIIPMCLRGRECGVVIESMDYFGCLRASTTNVAVNYVWDGKSVRRLTPVEYERLQGMPDNHTKLDDNTPDKLRFKAVGNSMTVPVVRWLGQRIMAARCR